jgi:XTP/dITP diphosphohydrolase
MKVLVATENTHKMEELSAIFRGSELSTPVAEGIDYSFEENGKSFLENSMGKAFALLKKSSCPVLADDSGLVVPALNGEPGVYSARYGAAEAHGKLDTPARNRYLLKKMEGILDRRAFFVCCMVLAISEERFFVAQEILAGEITLTPRGTRGFGYDPLFYLPGYGKTVAELPEEEKNRISHRGVAGKRIKALMDSLEA